MVDEPSSGKVWLPGDDAAEQALAQRHELGQFLTPDPVADFMGSLFRSRSRTIPLLDAGAGNGALTSAFVRRLCQQPSANTAPLIYPSHFNGGSASDASGGRVSS